MKTRLGMPNPLLSTLFECKIDYISEIFQTVLIFHHSLTNDKARFWTKAQPTEDESNAIFEYFNQGIEVLHDELRKRFKDPTGKNRIPVIILIDSTKVKVGKKV